VVAFVTMSKLWRGLSLALNRPSSFTFCPVVWKETLKRDGVTCQARYALSFGGSDEFGSDCVHQLLCNPMERSCLSVLRTFKWGINGVDSESQSYFKFGRHNQLVVARMWALPFRNVCLVVLQHPGNGRLDLVWVKTGIPKSSLTEEHDIRMWALNYNVLVEDPNDFVMPTELNGGMDSEHSVIVACASNCAAVILEGNTVLVFDIAIVETVGTSTGQHNCWRQNLTAEFKEPYHCWDDRNHMETRITAACYVLDSFLVLAISDGVIRARPRSNPKSEYYVENTKSLVAQMTSCFNVVALIHSYNILEVRLVTRIVEDPFLQLTVLYRMTGADCEHAPLLYGPYVVFAGIDGCWYRVKYESKCQHVKEEITIPGRPGWLEGRVSEECELEVLHNCGTRQSHEAS
jgi:hypothetical protein